MKEMLLIITIKNNTNHFLKINLISVMAIFIIKLKRLFITSKLLSIFTFNLSYSILSSGISFHKF